MAVDYRQLCIDLFGTDNPAELKKISEFVLMQVVKSQRGRKGTLTETDKQDILQLRRSGAGITELAVKYRVTREYISEILNPPIAKGCSLRLKYFCKNTICTLIDVDEKKQMVYVLNLTDDVSKCAFGTIENPTWTDFISFLESRGYAHDRPDIDEILDILGLETYDPLLIVEKTKGRKPTDSMRIEIKYAHTHKKV